MLKINCPCDVDGVCPYNAESYGTCEYWCGEDVDYDEEELDYEEDYDETGFNPYMGCCDFDC